MSFKTKRIAALSRDHAFQFKTVIIILLVGMAVAFGISLWRAKAIDAGAGVDFIAKLREDRPAVSSRGECVRLLEDIRGSRTLMQQFLRVARQGKEEEVPNFTNYPDMGVAGQFLKPDESRLLPVYAAKMLPLFTVSAEDVARFGEAAAAEPASGLLGSMHGDLLRLRGEYDAALAAYERGATDAETGADSMRRALDLCHLRNWQGRLRRLYDLPGWSEALLEPRGWGGPDATAIAAAAGDWPGVMQASWNYIVECVRLKFWVFMAALCGLFWFLIIHVGAGVPVRQWWCSLLGFTAGVVSIALTFFFQTVQEHWTGNVEYGDGFHDILYCVSGIGFREELAKLLLFVPLMFLLRKAPAARVVATAASVGLGFAILENINYFASRGAENVWARFITANFLHLGLTGMTGLALWQAVRQPAQWIQHFTVIFIGAAVLHGLWDFSPADERLAGDYSYFMYTLLVGLAFYFFRELLRYSQPQPGVPSAIYIYLAGGALILSVLLCCTAWDIGFRLAVANTFQPVLSLFAIGAAMYYQLRKA